MIIEAIKDLRLRLTSRRSLESACYLSLKRSQDLDSLILSDGGDEVQFALLGYKGVKEYDKEKLALCISRPPFKSVHFSNNLYKVIGMALLDRELLEEYILNLMKNGLPKEKYVLSLFFPDLCALDGQLPNLDIHSNIVDKCLLYINTKENKPIFEISDLEEVTDVADLLVIEDFFNLLLKQSQFNTTELKVLDTAKGENSVRHSTAESYSFQSQTKLEVSEPMALYQTGSPQTGDKSFGWLHITDLHCGMATTNWLWPNVEEQLHKDLERLHKKSGPWDIVLFTGDLTQKGEKAEFIKLSSVLDRLWKKFNYLGSTPIGVCQVSCRMNHAADAFSSGSLMGFRETAPIGSQLRV